MVSRLIKFSIGEVIQPGIIFGVDTDFYRLMLIISTVAKFSGKIHKTF